MIPIITENDLFSDLFVARLIGLGYPMIMNTETITVWNSKKSVAKTHKMGCSALEALGLINLDEEQIGDLIERGYKITQCPCCK